MQGIFGNAPALVGCFGLSGSRFPNALHGEFSSFRRNVVEFVTSVRHICLAAWLGDAG